MRTWLIVGALLAAGSACAYVRENFGGGVSLHRGDNAGIQVYINDQFVGGNGVATAGSDPASALRAALNTWNTASSANIHFLPLQSTSAGISSGDSLMVVAAATNASDISLLGSALAITELSWSSGSGVINSSDIVVNPQYSFSTVSPFTLTGAPYDLQAVLTHELGHALGADHTNVLAGTMYPFAVGAFQATLSSDELAFLNAVYPSSGSPASGTISGRVTLAGGTAVANPLIGIVDPATGVTVGTIGNSPGSWTVAVPPGSYVVYAEPFNTIRPAASYRVTAGQAFESTVYGSGGSPTLVTVSAGKTSTANFPVNGGTTPLALPLVGVTTVNGPFIAWDEGGPNAVPAGQSSDLLLFGVGFDSSLTDADFTIFGPGITVHPGSLRPDPKGLNVGGVPVLRLTVDVAARQTPALATLFITKGTDTLSLTGSLVITPAVPVTPQFTSASVVSAASYTGSAGGGAVSPGGIYSIYASPGTAGLGPSILVVDAGYDSSGKLPATLGNVKVTFDGVAAPLFFVFDNQINLQVPFEVAGRTSTQVVVTYNGNVSSAVTVPVLTEQPAFFTVTPQGTDSIVVNQDGTVNTAKNPALRGSYVTAYGTGVGKVSYSVGTGQTAPIAPVSYTGNYTVTLGNHFPIAALYAGWTPTTVGLAQWTFQIPNDSPTGKVTLVATDTVTGISTQTGTLFVQ